MAEKKDQANTGLNQLDIEQLEELLRVSLVTQEDSDADKILDLLQIIEDRKNQSQGDPDLDVDQAWETFQSFYTSEDVLYPIETDSRTMEKQPRKKRRSLRRILIGVAVAACLLALAIPTAVGTKFFHKMLGTWTEGEFQFESQINDIPSETSMQQGEIQKENDYTSLQEALDDYGITEKVVPTYIPEEFKLSDISVTELTMSNRVVFNGLYEADDNRSVSITYHYYLRSLADEAISATYEKDEREVQNYVVQGITHYIFHNYDRVTATWFNENIECSIHADCTVQEMKKMIDSIYSG